MPNPNLHLANRGPRKPVASKAHFQAAFAKMMTDMGVQTNGRKSKEDFWKLYRSIKFFEAAITASAGKISLAGIGRFQINMTGRGEEPHPAFRFYQSSFLDKFFRSHKEMVNVGRETDAELIAKRTFEVLEALNASASSEKEEIEVQESAAPEVANVEV